MDFKSFTDHDSPLMNGIYKFNLLAGLNVLVLLCCIPIVTAGAALTSMHDYLFHLHDDTEGAVLKSFIASFKRNFKQSTYAWLLFLGIFAVIATDIFIFNNIGFGIPFILKIFFVEAFVLTFGMFCCCFPVIANFRGSIWTILKDSFFMAAGMVKKMTVIMILYLLPWAILGAFPMLGWILLLIGVSGPAYVATCMYYREFKQIKEKIRQQSETGES
jgi:uncharacterized membrane protein YesL